MRHYKVIVIDDEEISADGIQMLIEMSGLSVDVVGVFYDSLAALEYLKENHADIVVTDINMPELSGLDLIEKMKTANSWILFIILTGYGSLEYAKQAMRYGVRHFLQKPCLPAELKESLSECISEVDRQAQERFLRLEEVMKRRILDCETDAEKQQTPRMEAFQMLLYEEQHYGTIHAELENLFRGIRYSFSNIKGTMVYYVDGSVSIRKELLQIIEKYSRMKLVVFYCAPQIRLTVEEVFEQGKKLFEYGFYIRKSCLIEAPIDEKDSLERHVWLKPAFEDFTARMIKNDISGAMEIFLKILDVCRERKTPPQRLLEQTENACRKWMKGMNMEKEFMQEGITKKILSTKSSEELQQVMNEIVRLLKQRTAGIDTDKNISANLNLIIEKYFGNSELSLKWISQNLLYLNADYMGKVYKKETAKKFSVRLQEVRMKKAEEFFKEGKRVSEVAGLVGYENNPVYFGQIFKKTYGMTPSRYAGICRSMDL